MCKLVYNKYSPEKNDNSILLTFLCWLIVGFLICFIGVSDVFAEEVAYSNTTFRVKECGSDEWSNWTNATQKLSIYSVNRLGLRLYFNNTTLNANTYYNISVTYNFYTEAPSINVMISYGKTTFYYNTTASESENIQGNNNNYSVRFEKDTENTNLIKAVYNVLVPVNAKFIAFNINWDEPNKETCRTLSNGFTISNIKVESLNDTNAIIDSNNQNTENIINNQNQNTQDIINNQNQNTQQEIESQQVCNYIDKKNVKQTGEFLNGNNTTTSNVNFGITDYININNSKITIPKLGANGIHTCFYNINKTFISCINTSNITNITMPENSYYARFSINITLNEPQFKICKNGNQPTNDSLNDLNDSLNNSDSSGATNDASNFFSNFTTDTFGLTSVITSPLNIINSLTSSSCIELNLPIPYLDNKYITLPCMNSIYIKYFGVLFTLYQTITFGIVSYWVIVRIFNQVKDFKNPEHDEIEVLDL